MARRPFPWVAALIAAGIVGLGIHYLLPVLVPFALACAAAYILNPVVETAEIRGLRRKTVVIAGFLLGAAAVALLAGTLLPLLGRELASLQQEAPAYAARFRLSWLELQRRSADRFPLAARQIQHIDASIVLGPLIDQAANLPAHLLSAFPLLSLLFLIPFISFFLLIDGPASLARLIQTCPSRYVEQIVHLVSEIDHSLGNYLRGLILVACALTAASFAGLRFLGVDQALWISVVSGVSSFVPYLGAVVGMVIGGLMASFQFGTAVAGVKVVLLFLAIRLGDEMILQPYIAKHSVHLHPLMFLFTFMTGGELFGFIGLVFAVPVACVIKALIEVGWSWYSSEARLLVPEGLDAAAIPYT